MFIASSDVHQKQQMENEELKFGSGLAAAAAFRLFLGDYLLSL